MSSTGLAEPTHEEGKGATHAAIRIVSPGKDEEEEKNQDRIMLMETTDSKDVTYQFAIVCDGTTTSPYAAAAAEHVAGAVHSLFCEEGLRRTVEALKEMRLALLEKPLKIQEGQSELLRSMFEEIVRQKYQSAYQTTFVAVCLKRAEDVSPGMISLKAINCGDSALFIFRDDGKLLYNNLKLEDELDRFKHGSPFTDVLPDSYREERDYMLFDFEEYPEDVHLLLCSDGLYDGFTNFKEICDWLHEHQAKLKSAELHDECLSELHFNLNRKKGDDDISFIWLHPVRRAAAEVEEMEKVPDTDRGKSEKPEPGGLAALLAAIFRWLGLRVQ